MFKERREKVIDEIYYILKFASFSIQNNASSLATNITQPPLGNF
jgi:hypothetical protein